MGKAGDELLGRRVVVTGAALGLLSACSGDVEEPGAGARRRRRRRRRRSEDRPGGSSGRGPAVTALTQDDLDDVATRLTDLLDGGDVEAFLTYARPSDAAQWRRMWTGLHTVPTVDRRFHLQAADDRWRNPEGGPVTATLRGVVAYRIEGCDAQPMGHLCDLSVFKPPRGRVRLQTLGPLRDPEAEPWLLTAVTAVTAPHAVLISRDVDAAAARDVLGEVDRGAARALDFITPPAGVSRICVTLGWPRARDVLYGGSQGDFVGSAHNYRYVDPQELADTGRRSSAETFDGSRVVIDPAAAAGQGAEAVTAHESVHALAFQWGPSAPPLYAEGLARWFEAGAGEIEQAARQVGAKGYGAFARRVSRRPGRRAFYDPRWQEANYTCAAMMCLHVARRYGETTLRDLVRAAYEGAGDPARTVLGMSQEALLREVAAQLRRRARGRSR